MKEKIRIFLDTDLLERYLLGETTSEESFQVERYISMYPEVSAEYNELQENLEAFAKMHAIKAPVGLKEKIVNQVRKQEKSRKRFFQYGIAASFATCLFAAATYFFYSQNQSLQEENIMVTNQIELLKQDMKAGLEDMRNQFIVLQNKNTKRLNVKGNRKAKELKAIAYINPVKKLSYINVSKLPNLPENQCFQMWAEVNGKMVNLGVIKEASNEDKLLPVPYAENSKGYITISKTGANQLPTLENTVAEIGF